ncbi:MAG: hypothetical protein KDD50_11420, partial [Bdellovibrionales bacterium]|nr:hypothetical protein [Bdellovibrionales bacterium]
MKHLTEYQSFTQLLTQTMDKIMTLSSLFIPLAMILFMATACQPKIEKYTLTKEVPSANAHDSGHADGTEAYGGDVTPSVALKIYDTLTYTSDQLAEETKLKGSGSRVEGIPLPKTPTFKDDMKSIWLGIAQYLKGGRLKNINGKNYATVALKLLDNGTGKDIFYDIEHSPYDVKFGEKYDWIDPKRMSQYNFGKCKDYLGDYRAAGAKLNDIGGPICINVTELAKQISDEELNKLFAMASHEHCHHFGFEEQDCV